MTRKSKAVIPISTALGLAQEVIDEGAAPYEEILVKAKRAKPGSKQMRNLLCELSVAANVIEVKAREQQMAIDEYLDSLPDDDD